MATDIIKVKLVCFVHVQPNAFHLTSYKQNLFLTYASYIEKLPEITLNFFATILSKIVVFSHSDFELYCPLPEEGVLRHAGCTHA